jgi:CBS domain containing-hemolysin-like protein
MTDSDTTPAGNPEQRAPSTEPPSSPAPAERRGPTLWQRIKGLLALRTVSLRDDLEVALESEANGESADFSGPERAILQNVLQLSEKNIDDVMVPRADIQAIDTEETLGTLVAYFRRVNHSRIPVYAESLDNITGFIHVKDALRKITAPVTDPEKSPVRLVSAPLKQPIGKLDIIRNVLFVPPYMPVGDLLHQMQRGRVHMAIVIDEYGGTDGLVTIEDLLEAVVGEIEDEHDEAEVALVRKINSNVFVASARAELEEVKEVIGPDFDPGQHAEEVETLGGLVFDLAGRVPAKGETVGGIKGFEFEVLAADSRQIKRLKIKRVKQRPPRPAPRSGDGPRQAAAE